MSSPIDTMGLNIRRFDQAGRDEYRDATTFKAFLSRYPRYESTLELSRRRFQDFPQLDDCTYLDWTGAAPPGESLRQEHGELLRVLRGNPHSLSPSSRASTATVDAARAAVLRFFNASPNEYLVIFTANTSAALKIVGEYYTFSEQRNLLLTRDNHNSVLGIREYARRAGAAVEMVELKPDELRLDTADLQQWLRVLPSGLFAFPAQSNFSGVKHDLGLIEQAQAAGWHVLLDAAAFVPTSPLDLSQYNPDFVAMSFYKMFGWPTGVGCLLVRREAVPYIPRRGFAGGTVEAASALGGWHKLAPAPACYEDGTVDFLNLMAIPLGLAYLDKIKPGRFPRNGMKVIRDRTQALAGWLLEQLQVLRHDNGQPLIQIYGPRDMKQRGSTLAFNFLDPQGRVIDERIVQRAADKAQVHLRDGCFCNPGAGEVAFRLSADKLIALRDPALAGRMAMDERLKFLGMPSGGAIRVSLGQVSNFTDVEQFLALARTFLNVRPSRRGLTARGHC